MFWNSKNWLNAPWMILFIHATKDRQSVIHNFQIYVKGSRAFQSRVKYVYISAAQLSTRKYAVKPGINPYPVSNCS